MFQIDTANTTREIKPINMGVIIILIAIYILGHFFEKSDHDRMKEADKLPPFTKEQARYYYNNELKQK